MGQVHAQTGPAFISCAGLGSCVGIVGLDPTTNVSGGSVVMLPSCPAQLAVHPGRYADLAIPALLEQMLERGAHENSIRFAVAGGAQAFRSAVSAAACIDIGSRNSAAVLSRLETLGLPCVGKCVGGELARRLTLDVESGDVRVYTALGGDRLICNLRDQ